MESDIRSIRADLPAHPIAGEIGVWECDLTIESARCDATMAALFGLPPEVAGRWGPFRDLRAAIVPEDRHLFDEKNDALRRVGGSMLLHYRTMLPSGAVRWVMIGGRYGQEVDRGGHIIGRGIALDVTRGAIDESALLIARPNDRTGEDTHLDRAAHHALAAARAIDEDAECPDGLVAAARLMLEVLGREIAHRLIRRTGGIQH